MRLSPTFALACLAATGMVVPAIAQTPVVAIDLQNFSYSPSPIHLRAGQAVTLTFTNRSSGGHDFTAKEFFAASKITAGRVTEGEVELGGGQSQSITLVPAAGTYKVHCGHTFHEMFGMHTEIRVD